MMASQCRICDSDTGPKDWRHEGREDSIVDISWRSRFVVWWLGVEEEDIFGKG